MLKQRPSSIRIDFPAEQSAKMCKIRKEVNQVDQVDQVHSARTVIISRSCLPSANGRSISTRRLRLGIRPHVVWVNVWLCCRQVFASQNGLNHAALEKAAQTSTFKPRVVMADANNGNSWKFGDSQQSIKIKVTIRKQLKDVLHQVNALVLKTQRRKVMK